MNRILITATFTCLTPLLLADPDKKQDTPDMIRFSGLANNDTLHGKFLSFTQTGGIRFTSPEAEEPIIFSTKKLHRITFNGGRAEQPLKPTSTVTLVNGDVIPGKILKANTNTLTIETQHLGTIELPADTITTISPTPHGGNLIYYGPLNPEGWTTVTASSKEEREKAEDDEPSQWTYTAGAWYAGTDRYCYLTRKDALTDRCKVSFKLAWRKSLYCNIVLHADFDPPEYEGEKHSSQNIAATVGRAYVITLSSHSATLSECTFDDEGKPATSRISQGSTGINLSSKNEVLIEFRIDRPNKTLMLYSDGQFKCKWDLGEKYIAPGNALAFRSMRYNTAQLRVSDVLITQWNGMKDSARSMQSNDRDVIMLTNGLDRFSGKLKHISDNKVHFRGTFDNDLTIPLETVQEIHMATTKLRKLKEDDKPKLVRFHLQPFGRISGAPSAGPDGSTKLTSPITGELTLDMKYVNLIDFSDKNSLLDFWNDNF